MKYFTLDWWRSIQEFGASDPFPDYEAHLDAIRDNLPPDLLLLQESISLHDAEICRFDLDFISNHLEIRLNGDDGTGGLRQFRLSYTELILFSSNIEREAGLGEVQGYGDLGYDEVDIDADGILEHRILFSSGIELRIRFRGFSLEYKDVAN